MRCCIIGIMLVLSVMCWAGITPTERGATAETERYRVTVRDGVVVSLFNRLTNEEYLDPNARLERVLPHLPAGMGHQGSKAEMASADKLHRSPWEEFPPSTTWECQHYPDAASRCAVKAQPDNAVTVTYTNLVDGAGKRFPDDTFSITMQIEAGTGDLLLSTSATSPRPGVYGSTLAFAPWAPAITAELPIYSGLHLNREMGQALWVNQWGSWWDFQFAALNGWKTGAFGIWCQDADLRYYKYLYYLINDEGISLAFNIMNVPPFEKAKENRNLPWRIQAYDKSWAQAVSRYRDWRLANQRIAPRPDWVKRVSFVNTTAGASPQWLNATLDYVGKDFAHPERIVAWGCSVRRQPFGQNLADNVPYAKFKEDMQLWKASGIKMMPYLGPLYMAGPFTPEDKRPEREAIGLKVDVAARAELTFREPNDPRHSWYKRPNMAYGPKRRWVLDWVKEYCQDYGADGIYHDETHNVPVDARGPIEGMTATQGMALYAYLAATENPNTIHDTEHLTEPNSTGFSLGILPGVNWGTAPNMRRQRIFHGSAVSQALLAPNSAMRPHSFFHDIDWRSDPTLFHWGMNLYESRAVIAGWALQTPLTHGRSIPFAQWANELWLQRTRDMAFIQHGLRPVFPDDYSRDVLSYFEGADGTQFRFNRTPYGTQFVKVEGAKQTAIFGRALGGTYAETPGGITGWVVYNDTDPDFYRRSGPAGMHPERGYTINPSVTRPPIYFSSANEYGPSFYESYVEDGCGNAHFALLRLGTLNTLKAFSGWEQVVIRAVAEPKAVYVNGKATTWTKVQEGQYQISVQSPANILVIGKEPAPGLEGVGESLLVRHVTQHEARDEFDPAYVTQTVRAGVTLKDGVLVIPAFKNQHGQTPPGRVQHHILVKAPEGPAKQTLVVTPQRVGNGLPEVHALAVNGQPLPTYGGTPAWPLSLSFKPGECKLISVEGGLYMEQQYTLSWKAAE